MVTDHQISRKDGQPVDANRNIPFPYGDPAKRIGGAGAAGEYRETVQFIDLRGVADQTVDQGAARAAMAFG